MPRRFGECLAPAPHRIALSSRSSIDPLILGGVERAWNRIEDDPMRAVPRVGRKLVAIYHHTRKSTDTSMIHAKG